MTEIELFLTFSWDKHHGQTWPLWPWKVKMKGQNLSQIHQKGQNKMMADDLAHFYANLRPKY